MSWCQQAKAVGTVHPADRLTRIEKKQLAPNGDKTPGTEQWKFAQRHPLLLSGRFWRGQLFVLIPQLG